MMTVWRLRQGADRRIRSGHPWVFSNELDVSPKGHGPGGPVELHDSKGQFLARGYGNPHSLIAFRALSFDAQVENPASFDYLHEKLLTAWRSRRTTGFKGSFRLCFGESDFLPGLVLDYYLVEKEGQRAQVFAAQFVTAGMDVALNASDEFFKQLVSKAKEKGLTEIPWEGTAVVLRNDVNIRKLEGLTVDAPRVIKSLDGWDLSSVDILLNSASDEGLVTMSCDLFEGQKTGFFLDQTHNIFLAVQIFKNWANSRQEKTVRIIDLCCYVGHWSAQIAKSLRAQGVDVEITLVDVSEAALAFAKKNVERQGARVIVHEMDVLEGLGQLPTQHYDIVIADPPAFIKAKKDLPTGQHAYLKMNTQAFRMTKKEGFVVSCSCSGLLTEEDFREALRKASLRNQNSARGILRGGHSADHPTLMQFPEGFYLKMYTHQVV